MGKLYCPEDGGHTVKVAFNPSAGERWCPDHPGTHLRELPKSPSAGGLGARRESPAESHARKEFNRVVKAHRCYYADTTAEGEPRREGHRCVYPLDAHHIVEKQWIRQYFGDLPEVELLAILYNPLIGAPLCRGGHENVKSLRIFWDELRDQCIEFCEEVDRRYGDMPFPGGGKRPSMLERLKTECPKREEAASTAASGRSAA